MKTPSEILSMEQEIIQLRKENEKLKQRNEKLKYDIEYNKVYYETVIDKKNDDIKEIIKKVFDFAESDIWVKTNYIKLSKEHKQIIKNILQEGRDE